MIRATASPVATRTAAENLVMPFRVSTESPEDCVLLRGTVTHGFRSHGFRSPPACHEADYFFGWAGVGLGESRRPLSAMAILASGYTMVTGRSCLRN